MKEIPGKRNQPRITDKKLEGDKVYYLVVKNRGRKWMDFEHMNDYLQLVMDYEKAQESLQKSFARAKESAEKSKDSLEPEEKIDSIRKSVLTQSFKTDVVSNIIFLNQVEEDLFFKVYYEGGHTEVMSNRQIRNKHPQELITFYEKNVKVDHVQEQVK